MHSIIDSYLHSVFLQLCQDKTKKKLRLKNLKQPQKMSDNSIIKPVPRERRIHISIDLHGQFTKYSDQSNC